MMNPLSKPLVVWAMALTLCVTICTVPSGQLRAEPVGMFLVGVGTAAGAAAAHPAQNQPPAGLSADLTLLPSASVTVSAFDPMKDVPAFVNYGDDADPGGHCFAMAAVTYQLHRQFMIRKSDNGLDGKAWRTALANEKLRYPLNLKKPDEQIDPTSAQIIGELLGESYNYKSRGLSHRTSLSQAANLTELTANPNVEAFVKALVSGVQSNWLQVRAGGISFGIRYLVPWNNREAQGTSDLIGSTDLPVAISMHHDYLSGDAHVVLVYKVITFDDRFDLYAYDSNAPPSTGLTTRLRVSRKTGEFECVRVETGERPYKYTCLNRVDVAGSPVTSGLQVAASNFATKLQVRADAGK